MNLGFCCIAESSAAGGRLEGIIASLATIGIALVNPNNGRVSKLDENGDQQDASLEELLGSAQSDDGVLFQLWMPDGSDVVCHARALTANVECYRLSLDGTTRNARDMLVRWAVDHFRAAVARGTAVLLVVDLIGKTAEVDWGEVAAEGVLLPATLPEILGAPSSWINGLSPMSSHSRQRLGHFDLLVARQLDVSVGLP